MSETELAEEIVLQSLRRPTRHIADVSSPMTPIRQTDPRDDSRRRQLLLDSARRLRKVGATPMKGKRGVVGPAAEASARAVEASPSKPVRPNTRDIVEQIVRANEVIDIEEKLSPTPLRTPMYSHQSTFRSTPKKVRHIPPQSAPIMGRGPVWRHQRWTAKLWQDLAWALRNEPPGEIPERIYIEFSAFSREEIRRRVKALQIWQAGNVQCKLTA